MATFVADLTADRKAVGDEGDGRETVREGGVASMSAVGPLIADGMKEVRYLDAIAHNRYARNADTLRAWQSASHIERAAQREKKPTPPAPPQ